MAHFCDDGHLSFTHLNIENAILLPLSGAVLDQGIPNAAELLSGIGSLFIILPWRILQFFMLMMVKGSFSSIFRNPRAPLHNN